MHKNKQFELSILIVSYNTCELTIDCIRSVYAQDGNKSFEIIVVDNASSDGSVSAIEREFPDAHLISLDQNIGFARANNIAALRASGERFLLLNPDTIILEQAVDRLAAFADCNQGAGIWGGRTLFGDRSLNPTSCWRFQSLWSIFVQATGLSTIWRKSDICNPEAYGGWKRDYKREVDIVTGCFFLIERSLWETLNGFDENFFMYAEEADLCFRARGKGARPLFTPDACIIHYGGASEPVFSEKIVKLFSGKVSFLKKHWPIWKQIVGITLFKLWVFNRVAGYATVAFIIHSESSRQAADEWKKIWSRRKQWSKGYPQTQNNVNV